MKRILPLLVLLFVAQFSLADELKPLTNVRYGDHPRNVLDFYPANSDKPTPVVLYIHGGGWRGGDKKTNPKIYNDNGISVVAINYRYVQNGVEAKIEPPVKAPLHDAARALQFVRSKAREWNLDKGRIGTTGAVRTQTAAASARHCDPRGTVRSQSRAGRVAFRSRMPPGASWCPGPSSAAILTT